MTPMQLNITEQTQVFLLSCVAGLGLGAVFDCFRVLRAAVKHPKFLVFIEDFLYALFFGGVYFIFAVAQTGQIRLFTLIGMLIGALMERVVFGNMVVFIVGTISKTIWRFLISPITCFIAKITGLIKGRFVKKYPIFQKNKKSHEKVLKV